MARIQGTLSTQLGATLRERIAAGEFPPGSRLPTEAQLCEAHQVSRTVVREAIAELRADGLVEARRGSGVYVLEPQPGNGYPFRNVDIARISSVIETLELRAAVEVEAAGLAAMRRSPLQVERIIECKRSVAALAHEGAPTAEADFALHLAIAEATNNTLFAEFLTVLGSNAIPRRMLEQDASEPLSRDYLARIDEEHDQIVQAILDQDAEAARDAMRRHLSGSQARYRRLIQG